MEIHSLRCPNCYASIDAKDVDFSRKIGRCRFCSESFVIEQAAEFAKVEVDKTKDVENFRRNLTKALEKDDASEIKRYSENVLDILPDDYDANYFYAYALGKLGDSRYLYDFYKDTDKIYTEESAMRVADHVIEHGQLRDEALVTEFLKNLSYNSEDYLTAYREVFAERAGKEDLYDDIARDVFICHRSTDGEIASNVVKELEADGNKCWISSRNLRPNDNENYWDNIKKAIRSCRVFLVVSSRSAMMSTDVKNEMAFAKELNKRRLELKIDESEHNAFFKDFFDGCKWIKGEDYSELKARVADLVFKALTGTDNVVVHKVNKVQFTPIQEAKPVEKKVFDALHVHKFEKVADVEPTCLEGGYTLFRCSCGEEKKSNFIPKRTEHKFELAESKAPTCTENGYNKYECVYCDATKTETVSATGHKWELTDVKEPTCKDAGHKIYKCSVCSDTKVETLPKTAHSYGSWKITKYPTCTMGGEEAKQCSFCGDVQRRSVPQKGHTFGDWITQKEPTCLEKGIKARQCKDCGFVEKQDIPTTQHVFSDWQTLPDGNYQERVCSKCGYVEKRTTEEYKQELVRIEKERRREEARMQELARQEEEQKKAKVQLRKKRAKKFFCGPFGILLLWISVSTILFIIALLIRQ